MWNQFGGRYRATSVQYENVPVEIVRFLVNALYLLEEEFHSLMVVKCNYVQLLQLISGLGRNCLRWLESDHELGAIQRL